MLTLAFDALPDVPFLVSQVVARGAGLLRALVLSPARSPAHLLALAQGTANGKKAKKQPDANNRPAAVEDDNPFLAVLPKAPAIEARRPSFLRCSCC